MEEIVIGKIIVHDGRMHKVLRVMPLYSLSKKDGAIHHEKLAAWKEHIRANHILKTQTHFIFCETLEEAVWEDIKES